MESRYDTYNHAKYSIRYHIILSVKYHKRILRFLIDDLKRSFVKASKNGKFSIEAVETDLANGKDHHVHLLVKSKPTVAPYEIVSLLKRHSTVDAWRKHVDFLRTQFWRGKHLLWTRGYFCCTVGDASRETIERYINEQG